MAVYGVLRELKGKNPAGFTFYYSKIHQNPTDHYSMTRPWMKSLCRPDNCTDRPHEGKDCD